MFNDDIFDQMRKIFRDMPFIGEENFEILSKSEVMNNGQPVVWGYQYSIGPDGVPRYSVYSNVDKIQKQLENQFTQFGHSLPEISQETEAVTADKDGYRVAHTDIVQDENELRVIIELPGVDKKDIDLRAKENFLTVMTSKENYKYKAEIPLQVTTIPKKIKASFKNGILELKLPIVKNENQDKGDNISID